MPSREQFLQSLQEIESEGKAKKQSAPRSSFLEGLTAKGLDAVLFGGADELQAAAAGGYDYLFGGGNFGKTYDTTLEKARKPLREFEEDYPKTSMAIDVGSLAIPLGGLAKGAYTGYKAFKAGKAAAPKVAQVAKSVGLGAGVGGATGFLSGEGVEGRTKGAILGAGVGGVAGGAADYVTQLAGRQLGRNIDISRIGDNPQEQAILNKYIGSEQALQDAPEALAKYQELKSQGYNVTPAEVFASMGDTSLLELQGYLQRMGSNVDTMGAFNKQRLEQDLPQYYGDLRNKISQTPSVDIAGRNLVEGAASVESGLRQQRSQVASPYYDKAKIDTAIQDISVPVDQTINRQSVRVSDEGDINPQSYDISVNQMMPTSKNVKVPNPDYGVELRPIVNSLKKAGGIDPNSSLGKELYRMGITNKAVPGLFKHGGAKRLDSDYTEIVNELGMNPNMTFDDFINRIDDEIRNAKGRRGGQTMYTTAEEITPVSPDITSKMNELGIDITGKTKEQLQDEIAGINVPEFTNYADDPEAGRFLQKRFARTVDGAESLKDPIVQRLLNQTRNKFASRLKRLGVESIPDNSVALLHQVKGTVNDKINSLRQAGNRDEAQQYQEILNDLESDLMKDDLYSAATNKYKEVSKPVSRFQESVLSDVAKQKNEFLIRDAYKAPKKIVQVTPDEANYVKSKLPQDTLDDAVAGYFDTLFNAKESNGRIQSVFSEAKKHDKVLQTYLGDKYQDYKKTADIFDMIAKGRGSYAGSPTAPLEAKKKEVEAIKAMRSFFQGDKVNFLYNVSKMIAGRGEIDEALLDRELADNVYNFVMTPKGLQKIKELASKEKKYLNNRYVIKQLGKAANVYAAQESARQLTAKEKKKQEVPTNIRQFLGVPARSNQNKQDYIPSKTLDLGTIYPQEQ